MTESHISGKVKFIIPVDGELLINDVPSKFAPHHYLIALAINLINKDTAIKIFREGQDAAVVAAQLAPGLLGGYAGLVQENPPKYKYLGGSSSLTSATEEQFNDTQNSSSIKFLNVKISDVTEKSLF